MKIEKNETFEDKLNELEDILNKFKDYVSSKDSSRYGAHFHSFGPHNLNMEASRASDIVACLNKSYVMFKTMSNPSMVMKLVNEKQALKSSVTPWKKRLENAMKKISDATKTNSLKVVLWKLEAIATEERLDFDCGPNSNCFISSDMFYIEVLFKADGSVDDVTLHGHTGEHKSCQDMVHILRSQNYEDFRVHLRGLKNLTNLPGDAFNKSNILSALEVLENDIMKVMKLHSSHGQFDKCVLKGPFGFVTPRIGGKYLRCTYSASPTHLMNTIDKDKSLSHENFDFSKAYNVYLCVCAAMKTKLPNHPLMSVDGDNITFSKLDETKKIEVPANFLLQFKKPLPVSLSVLKTINKILEKGEISYSSCKSQLDELILCKFLDVSPQSIAEKKYKMVIGDDVYRCRYHKQILSNIFGVLVSNIPFSHPSQLYSLIKIIRRQSIFNILLCNCFYDIKGTNIGSKKIFDYQVIVAAEDTIIITFAHPLDQSLCSLEIVVSESADVLCTLNVVPDAPIVCTKEYLTKVLNRCLSVPITLRCLAKKAASYKPDSQHVLKNPSSKKAAHKLLTLNMPPLSQIHSHASLTSPHLTASPSTFLIFSANGISPSTPVFAFDPTQKQIPSRKRRNSVTTPGSSQSSDGNRTPSKLKLPKITLKRKRNKEYEIDQTKSDLSESDSTPVSTEPQKVSEISPFVYTTSHLAMNESMPQHVDATLPMFPETVTFGDLPLDNENDFDNLLGIPSEPFIHDDQLVQGSSNVSAFDLDALTSVSNFDTDNANMIDPSELVRSSETFDLTSSVGIDIDSLMNDIQ